MITVEKIEKIGFKPTKSGYVLVHKNYEIDLIQVDETNWHVILTCRTGQDINCVSLGVRHKVSDLLNIVQLVVGI